MTALHRISGVRLSSDCSRHFILFSTYYFYFYTTEYTESHSEKYIKLCGIQCSSVVKKKSHCNAVTKCNEKEKNPVKKTGFFLLTRYL